MKPMMLAGLSSLALLSFSIESCGDSSSTSLPSACTTSGTDVIATEIAAPSGLPTVTGYVSDGPGPRRVMLATSTDGITFTRLNKVLSDQANTPNMIVEPSGKILIYYTAYNIDPSVAGGSAVNNDGIAVAVSEDQGSTWKYYCAGMAGFGSHPSIGDPDVVRLTDGTYRMYVTNGNSSGNILIYSATSTDGISFTKEGEALNMSSSSYKDSLTAYVGSQYVMYVLSATTQMRKATSTLGKTFTPAGSDTSFQITVNSVAENFVLSNWMALGGGSFRIYGFNLGTKDIRSFTTSDATTYTPVSTISLGLPLNATYEKSWVKDAAVQRLSGGTYLMAYVTEIP